MTKEQLPNLIIVGPGKSGTTSLFWYLSQHPAICASDVKETRYFAPITEGGTELPPLNQYTRHFRHCRAASYVLEASPQYFHGGSRIISAMGSILEDPHIIVTLRDPVERLWSSFRFAKSRMDASVGHTFDAYVEACQRVYEKGLPLTAETRAYWTIAGGFYAKHLSPWFESFGNDLRIVFFEHLTAAPARTVAELCRWLRIDDSGVHRFNYSVENRTILYRNALIQRIALALNTRSERLLRDRRGLKEPLRKAYYLINRKSDTEQMSPSTRNHLQEIFRSANASLARELLSRGYTDPPPWLTGPAKGEAIVEGTSRSAD
jgi:hypothetical protein